jgi:hypothetical protein
MNTTNFVCKDPDNETGRRFQIPVIAGRDVLVDERVVAANPTTFTIIPRAVKEEAASDADDGKEIDNADTEYTSIESLDVAPVEPSLDEVAPISEVEAANAKEAADEVDAEILETVIADAESEDDEDEFPKNDENHEVEPDVTEDIVAEEKAHAEAELMETIHGFKTRKKLDVWGAGIGITLDARKSLTNMKADAMVALNLG